MSKGHFKTVSERLSLELIRIGAVVFSPDRPFTWASGIESPVYCDNRLTMSHPPVRKLITDGFEEILRLERETPDVIVGTATAGIPHAAWLAERLDLPMAYVRSSRKSHGKQNRIEGTVEPGSRAVVVEDLVSTGGSALEAVQAVTESRAHTRLVLAIFSYGLPGADVRFTELGVNLRPITTFDNLVSQAAAKGLLDPAVLGRLKTWHSQLGRELADQSSEAE